MRDFALVFKALFKNQNTVRIDMRGKKRLPQWIVMSLSMLPLVLMFSILLVFIALSLKNTTELADLMNTIMTATQVFILFTMLAGVISTLYNSPDTPFLSSLPLKPTSVFFAKFSIVYLSAMLTAMAFMIPSMLAVSIAYAANGNYLFYGFYPLIILLSAAAPLLPLFIIVLFSLPLTWIGSFFKGRALLKSILLILFYVALMCVFIVVIYLMNTSVAVSDGLSQGAIGGISAFSSVMYTNRVLILFCMGIDAAKNFGISFGVHAGMIVIAVLLAMLFYRRISSKTLETRNNENKKTVNYRQNGIISSLIKRDLMAIMRNPSMAMSCFGTLILAPIFMGVLYLMTGEGFGGEAASTTVSEMMLVAMASMYSGVFLSGANMLAGMAYTREGQSFFISKALPIRAQDSVASKLILSLSASLPSLIICVILALALYKISIVSVMFYTLCMLLLLIGANSLNIYIDMRRGHVNWKTAADMRNFSRGNISNLIVVLLAVIPFIVMMVLAMLLGDIEVEVGRVGVLGIFWAVNVVICAVIAFVGLYLLKEKGLPIYEKIGENKKTPVAVTTKSLGSGGRGGMLG